MPNASFALKGPSGESLPPSLVTLDLWHVFYQNQMQIKGGKNDQFVVRADSGGGAVYDFAQELADDYLVMERGEFIAHGQGKNMETDGVRGLVAI